MDDVHVLSTQIGRLFCFDRFYWFWNAAAVFGTLYILRAALRFLWGLGGGLCAFVLAPLGISRINLRKYGSWAVVTGASEGIGRGYALELARQGLNVVIMSRSQEKLDKVADEIKEKYGGDVRVMAVDFTDGQEVFPRLAEELADLDIGVLVNNVGLCYEYPEFFLNVPHQRLRMITELNCQALVQMTHLLLPKMLEKNRGAVVNISSAAYMYPVALLNVYAATKIFVKYFSDALRKEYQDKGILVQTVSPWVVATSMTTFMTTRTSIIAPGPVKFARSAVATIGIQNTTCGCISHALQESVTSIVPMWLADELRWKLLLFIRACNKSRQNKQR